MGASPWRHTPSEGGGVAFVDALNSDALELAFGTGIAVEDWGDVKEQKRRFLKRSKPGNRMENAPDLPFQIYLLLSTIFMH